MNSIIKNVLWSKGIRDSIPVGVDETVNLITFEAEDLNHVINNVIQVCADMVTDPVERMAILKLGNLQK